MLFKHSQSKRRGTHAVEFAVVLPVFWMLIMGLLEMGRGFMLLHIATHAASSGARAAIVGPDNSSADTYGQLWTDTSARVEADLQAAGVNLTGSNTTRGTTTVYVTPYNSTTTTSVSDSTNTTQLNSGDQIRVEVGVNYANNSWIGAWPQYIVPSSGNISGATTLWRQ